ncbi:zinc-binding domain-containing protein [Xylogone sp. PMI_703]|nr:zinc-binding domain-containing protein [Xylogone sp. PMI_703]
MSTSFMFPLLHQDVSNAVSNEIGSVWFNNKGGNEDCNNKYSTNVMGKFRCNNDRCSNHGWGSKKVSILIRGYPENGYNALVFNQCCKSCNKLGTLTLDENSYIDRVTYRLKKWAGVWMEEQHYAGKVGLPHKRELCEGCKQGYCQGMTRKTS